MTCKNCKYCHTHTYEAATVLSDKIKLITIGRCHNPLLTDDDNNPDGICPDNGVYATCDEHRGEFRVGPNFGCIHFEEKTL